MDENFNVQEADVLDTTPEYTPEEDENIESDDEGFVTPYDDLSAKENVVRNEDEEAQTSLLEKKEVSEPFISVQYNHKSKDFTKEEAIKYIQKGMHTESLRAKLECIAKEQGTDVNALVDKMRTGHEMLYKQHLEELYG